MTNKAALDGNASLDLRVTPREWDLVGPTIEDDVRRLINRYGAQAVKLAIQDASRSRRGRPKVDDAPELRPIFEKDARVWLQGGDPFAARSNYSIAHDIAEREPGHNRSASIRRIGRKLVKKPYDRQWFTLVAAERIAYQEYPFGVYLNTVSKLNAVDPDATWENLLRYAKSEIADYEAKNGSAPPLDLTQKQIANGVRTAVLMHPMQEHVGGPLSVFASQTAMRRGGF